MSAAHDASLPRRRTPVAFLIPLAIVFVLLGATQAFAITRATVLDRAQRRIDRPVGYSQSKYYAGYRTDCSGYVSMCWATGSSYNTRTFYQVTHRISVADLRPGDALLKKGYHIRLFYGWLDDARTTYISYESAYWQDRRGRIHSIAEDLGYGYVPVRYDRISNGHPRAATSSRTRRSTRGRVRGVVLPSNPCGGRRTPSSGARRSRCTTKRSTVRPATPCSSRTRARIPPRSPSCRRRPRSCPARSTGLNAWAMSAHDPRGVELALAYLDTYGDEVGVSRTTGNAPASIPTAFKLMSITTTAPPTAIAARVSVRLAGGSVETSAGPVAGTSVILDDMSLARPQVRRDGEDKPHHRRTGTKITLAQRGRRARKRRGGSPAVVYVKKPGSAWSKLATVTVAPSGSAGAWRASTPSSARCQEARTVSAPTSRPFRTTWARRPRRSA